MTYIKFTKLWFLRWLISWASFLEGLAGITSLGLWHPHWALKRAKIYSKTAYYQMDAEMKEWQDEQSNCDF